MKNIIILVGPSGSGKSTLEQKLNLQKIVSHTTRKKRDDEVNGVDYHFVTKSFFRENEEDFIEMVDFGGNFYGVHKDSIPKEDSVLVAEPNGLKQMIEFSKRNGDLNIFSIFLDVSEDEQRERMFDRGDSSEMIDKRLSFDNIREESKDISFNFKINTSKVNQDSIANVLNAIIL